MNDIVCLPIVRSKPETQNSVLCPFISKEPECNIKYITSPLGHGALGGLNKIVQLAMKVSNSRDKRVMTMIITKSVRKEKSVKTTKNSDRKSISGTSMGDLSPCLLSCQFYLTAVPPLEEKAARYSQRSVVGPPNPSCCLPPSPAIQKPLLGPFPQCSQRAPASLLCACLFRRAVSAPYQLVERPIWKGECIFVLASGDFSLCVWFLFFSLNWLLPFFFFFSFPSEWYH